MGAACLYIKASTFQNGLFPHIHTHLIQNFWGNMQWDKLRRTSLFLYLHKNGKIFQNKFTLGRTVAPHVLAPELACNGSSKWSQTKRSFPSARPTPQEMFRPPKPPIYFDEAHVGGVLSGCGGCGPHLCQTIQNPSLMSFLNHQLQNQKKPWNCLFESLDEEKLWTIFLNPWIFSPLSGIFWKQNFSSFGAKTK